MSESQLQMQVRLVAEAQANAIRAKDRFDEAEAELEAANDLLTKAQRSYRRYCEGLVKHHREAS